MHLRPWANGSTTNMTQVVANTRTVHTRRQAAHVHTHEVMQALEPSSRKGGALAVEALRRYRLAAPALPALPALPAPKTFGPEPFPSEELQVQAEPGGRDE